MSEAVTYLTQLDFKPALTKSGEQAALSRAESFKPAMVSWIDGLVTITQPIMDKFENSNASFHLQFGLDVHAHNSALSLNEELLLNAVHDYTEMVFKGANIMLAGIKAVRRIRSVRKF